MHAANCCSGFVLAWFDLHLGKDGNHGKTLSDHPEAFLPLISAPSASYSLSNRDL